MLNSDQPEALTRVDAWNRIEAYSTEIYSLWHHSSSYSAIRKRIDKFSIGKNAIDFGCGEGYWLGELKNFKRIIGVDFSTNLVNKISKPTLHTEIVVADIGSLSYEHEFDFALNLNAFMPENHTAALKKFSTMLRALRPGGRLIFVIFSAEGYQAFINLLHFQRSASGDELGSLKETIDLFFEKSDNPLGYIRQGNGTVVKFWVRDEAEAFFRMSGTVEILEYFRVPHIYDGPKIPGFDSWFHGWVIEKSA